ncbi:MAG TPA: hypothetical protein VFP65_09755, partial [Anaeromyxobacteraceae bacterium]|nr:hypothetical protein [Anaeromyxobacteraceae bacterium]
MKRLLTGVEALARGAAEEGVGLLVTQRVPGLRGLAAAARREGVACEVAAGARLALDLAAGASLAGARAVAAVGDVFGAAESLQAAVQAGLSGLVVVGVDDPGLAEGELCGDGRALARALDLPCLEPCDAAECGPHLAAALSLSERWGTPVFVRMTVRVARTARPVELGAPRAATAAGLEGRADRHALGPGR